MGAAATAENDLAYRLAAQARRAGLRRAARLRADAPGQDERLLLPGLQPAAVRSRTGRRSQRGARRSSSSWSVIDPLQTETARFWENHGEHNDVEPEEIQTEVSSCRRTCFAEDEGSLTNSGRWLQWHWAGGTPPGEAKSDVWIMAQLYKRLKALYQKEGGPFPDPILNLHWPYKNPERSARRTRSPRRSTATALDDVHGPGRPTKVVLQKGKQVVELRRAARRRLDRVRLLDLFRLLQRGRQQHGPPRQQRSRRHRRLSQVGVLLAGQPPHPLQPRVGGYAAASPGIPSASCIEWDGAKWTGYDVPDIAPDGQARTWCGPSS